MKPSLFSYRAPKTLGEALQLLASDPDAAVLAGGQSLLPAMNFRVAMPSLLVDIQHVEGLTGLTIENGEIIVRAMTRHRELELNERVARANPLIAEVMQHIAHVPIRNRGTVVGSLCHADPSAEMPLLFVLLDGSLVLTGPGGTRTMAARDFFRSFLTTARQRTEIVVEARLPLLAKGAGFAFDEVTRRHGDYALVGVGCVLQRAAEGHLFDVRLAACGIADRPIRLTAAEEVLQGSRGEAASLERAADVSLDAVTQPEDASTSTAYRVRVLRGLLARVVQRALARVGGDRR
jgi:carbon-monoxide dehydrogenase medium subunit